MTQHDTEPLARQLLQHARALAELRHDLNQLTHETTDIHADLIERLEDLRHISPPSLTTTSWCWRSLDPECTQERLQHLREWVTWLRDRYPIAKRVPACWAEHPEVVEELTALWLAWHAAYEKVDAPLTAPAEWHDRWLPGLLSRLERGAFALLCRDGHEDRPSSAYSQAQTIRDDSPAT
jgi:hypothetical protein